jgi:hypothetical protein
LNAERGVQESGGQEGYYGEEMPGAGGHSGMPPLGIWTEIRGAAVKSFLILDFAQKPRLPSCSRRAQRAVP